MSIRSPTSKIECMDAPMTEDLAQVEIIRNWCNNVLSPRGIVVTELFEDLKDGFVLYSICEILGKGKMRQYGKLSTGKMRIMKIANQNVVFKFFKEMGVRLSFVGPTDVVDGNVKLVLSLMWSVMEFFAIDSSFGQFGQTIDAARLRFRLINWLLRHSMLPNNDTPPFEVLNLSKGLQDGMVLLSVVHHFSPSTTKAASERATGNPEHDLRTALEDLANNFGVEKNLVESRDLEERFTIPYLIQMVSRISERFPDDQCHRLTDETLDNPPELGLASPTKQKASLLKEAAEASLNDVAYLNVKVKELEMENKQLKQKLEVDQIEPGNSAPQIGKHLTESEVEMMLVKSGVFLELERQKASQAARHLVKIKELENDLMSAQLIIEASQTKLDAHMAASQESRNSLLEKNRSLDAERLRLHNTIQELRGNIRVFARVRPFLAVDGVPEGGHEPWLLADPDGSSIHALSRVGVDLLGRLDHGGRVGRERHPGAGEAEEGKIGRESSHTFKYDRVFGHQAGQEEVFQEVSDFVQSALDGYNCVLFSYGQTGSGKTHTMIGSEGEMRGIIPRAVEQVAHRKAMMEESGWTFEMRVSFIEIYCEQIKDLLASDTETEPTTKKHKIVRNEFGQSIVTDVEIIPVDPADRDAIKELMEHAASLRSTSATQMNAVSSRSHSIFTLHLTAHDPSKDITLHGQLNLVDLAGSERVHKSGVSGQALTEAKHINTSLSALAGVFIALGKKTSHVPFRDSKLTELLHPAMTANGKTLMVLNLSPIESSLKESLSSLRFGTSVNACELGKAVRVIKQGAGTKLLPALPNASKPRSTSLSPARTRALSPVRNPSTTRNRMQLNGKLRSLSPVKGPKSGVRNE